MSESTTTPPASPEWDPVSAILCVESEGSEIRDVLSAWAYIIKSGCSKGLQGWYGRTIESLIRTKTISPEGDILV
jgi:hypothetical protein